MPAHRRALKLDEHSSCTTRAVFLEGNAARLSDQVDLEEYLHSPNKPLPPKLRGLPAPQPTPVGPTVRPPPATAPTFTRSRPRVDGRARAARNDD